MPEGYSSDVSLSLCEDSNFIPNTSKCFYLEVHLDALKWRVLVYFPGRLLGRGPE